MCGSESLGVWHILARVGPGGGMVGWCVGCGICGLVVGWWWCGVLWWQGGPWLLRVGCVAVLAGMACCDWVIWWLGAHGLGPKLHLWGGRARPVARFYNVVVAACLECAGLGVLDLVFSGGESFGEENIAVFSWCVTVPLCWSGTW